MQAPVNKLRFLVQAFGVVVLLAAAAFAGLWLGRLSVPDYSTAPAKEEPVIKAAPEASLLRVEGMAIEPNAPPVFFAAGAVSESEWNVVLEEVAMANAAGVHQYIVTVPFPWGGPKQLADTVALVNRVITADPKALLYLRVSLNPPESWLQTHGDECAVVQGKAQPYPSAASAPWQDEAGKVLAALVAGMDVAPFHERILGYVLGALVEDCWYGSGGFDGSSANLTGFRQWLRKHYGNEAALQGAWSNPSVTFEAAAIPEKPGNSDLQSVFFTLPEMQPVVDFLRYTSSATAGAISSFTALVKSVSESNARVLVPYGFAYELPNNDAGHFALETLLNGPVDGFLSPVSYVDRGLGGAGGMMGPVDSAHAHNKQWYLVDDTRTGMARDPSTGEITRMKGLRAEDVYNVQRRNFAAALVHRLGLVWSDPMGEGWLHDMEQWDRLSQMRAIYARVMSAETHEGEAAPPVGNVRLLTPSPPDEGEGEGEAEEGELEETVVEGVVEEPPPGPSRLMVVVDESSRFYQQCDAKLNEVLLINARDAALKAGLATRFCLLQDVVNELAPAAPVYLFLNAFHLSRADRERLHARLQRGKAIALWLYAPGYVDEGAGVENVAATVRMNVVAFQGGGETGSTFSLEGRWLKQGEAFGPSMPMMPLFYVDDSEADTLAQYRSTSKASVAMRPQEGGWTSVYFAEPALTPALLREILRLFEQHLYVGPSDTNYFDTIHVGDNLVAIHARQIGERVIVLGQFCNVEDLFDSSIGWPEKQSFYLPMKTGETRLFKLSPL